MVYVGMAILLNIPYIQQHIAAFAARELSDITKADISIGRIDMGLLNRIIIDDIRIEDLNKKEALRVKRLSAKFDIIPLLNGKISISSVQLFGFTGNVEKETPDSPLNIQFILDALTSKDDKKESGSINLRINSILIRRGRVAYNVLSEPESPGTFNASHINLRNIIANISLKALQTDSINASIKRMSIDESNSGFELKKLTMKLTANDRHVQIDNFAVEMPGSSIHMDDITMDYDSMQAFRNFGDEVRFKLKSAPSHIALKDISPFVPALRYFSDPIDFSIDVDGTVNQLNCNNFSINYDDDITLTAYGSLTDLSDPHEAFVYGKMPNLHISSKGFDILTRNITGSDNTPEELRRMNFLTFSGEVSGYFTDIVAFGTIRTGVGNVRTDIKLSSDSNKGLFAYSGSVATKELKLNKLLDNDKLGNISFNIDVDGKNYSGKRPEVILDGEISDFEYNGYKYDNIQLDGEYKNGGFNGNISIDDDNGSVEMNGIINLAEKIPTFNFTASVDNLCPNRLNLTDKYKDAVVSVNVKADFVGNSIDNMIGSIDIDDLLFTSPEKSYSMNNLHIEAAQEDNGNNKLSVNSPFMKADFTGHFKYSTISASINNILSQYLPSLIAAKGDNSKIRRDNELDFDIYVYNTNILSDVFDIPIHIYMPSTFKGHINERNGHIGFEGYFPRFRYGEKIIESAMVSGNNDDGKLSCKARFINRKDNDNISASIEASAASDKIDAKVNWGNSATSTYSGRLAAVTTFLKSDSEAKLKGKGKGKEKESKPELKTVVDIKPTNIILNDSLWQLHRSRIVVESGNIEVNHFYFDNNDRHLLIDGRVSKEPSDTLTIKLKDINLGYVFDIADVTDDVKFAGDATGTVYVSDVHNDPILDTRLDIRDFSLNDALLGDLDIYGAWDNENKGILLDAIIKNKRNESSTVKGHIFPLKPTSGLDLNINADGLNIKFIERYMNSIVQELSGDVSGNVHFYGKFKELTLDGAVMADAKMRFDILGTSFKVKDSIRLHPEGIDFTNIKISDVGTGNGIVNGRLRYNHFKDIQYMLNINMDNMLVMNTHESVDFPFYGTAYVTGTALLQGNAQDGLNANIAVSTNKNTTFVYNTGTALQATDTQFISFIDKTPQRDKSDIQVGSFYDEIKAAQSSEEEEESETDIRLSLLIDATPDVAMKLVMDPASGDYISGKGNGNIRAEFYNKGDFKLFGNYNIQQGIYKFSLQEVIRKEFSIKSGSTISFNGDPLDANLDINASYTVPSASLNDLIPDASTIVQQPNVKVNCMMNLTGILQSPTIKMSIELPNERDEVQALVRNYISTDEQMNMQMLYLLGIGKFYTENNGSERQSDMMSSVLSSTLSGQLNNLLSQMIDNNNWNIGTNLSTGEKGWTDMEVEGILSGQLLNNRLLINGNFGYRDNPMANTNFVGDFEAEWLLNRSGDIRLKAYNETNDRYYTRTNLTTQGIGIMFKKDFNKWSDLFFWNKLRMKRLSKESGK